MRLRLLIFVTCSKTDALDHSLLSVVTSIMGLRTQINKVLGPTKSA